MTDHPSSSSGRRRWDLTRRITAWAGLLELPVVVILMASFVVSFGAPVNESIAFAIVGALAGPAVIAGLISGGRYFVLYADYGRRLDPTAQLSPEDARKGQAAVGGVMGDGLWGSLIAGLAGGIPAALALCVALLNPFFIIGAPLLVFTVGIGWFAGWVAGAVVSAVLGTALGLALGSSRRRDAGSRLIGILVGVFLPLLLIAVVVPALGVRFADGRVDVWAAILLVAGIPIGGAEFVFGDVLLWVARIALWAAALLFAALVAIGSPAFLRRLSSPRAPSPDVPPIPPAPPAG